MEENKEILHKVATEELPDFENMEDRFSDMDKDELIAELEKMFGIPKRKPLKRKFPKINRNSICPCGSGLKFKKCCQSELKHYLNTIENGEYDTGEE